MAERAKMKEKQSEWEKEFDKKITHYGDGLYADNFGDDKGVRVIKNFISNLLLQQKQELRERTADVIKDACSDYFFIGDGSDNTIGENEAMEISEYIITHPSFIALLDTKEEEK